VYLLGRMDFEHSCGCQGKFFASLQCLDADGVHVP
jgi:hypothetical protein